MTSSRREGAWLWAAALTVGLVLSSCGVAAETVGSEQPDSAPTAESVDPGEEVTVRGVVVENTIDPCLFPQPEEVCEEGIGHLLHLEAHAGQQVAVYYGGHHGEPCPNPEANEGAEQARAGTEVQVFAEVESVADDGFTLSVCGSSDYHVEEVK